MNKRIPFLIGSSISLMYLIINLILLKDYSLSWDFHYHHYAGLYHLGLPVPSINDPPEVPFSLPDSRLTVEDPFGPFTQIIPSASLVVFHERLKLLPFDIAYNLPIVIFGSLGVGLLFWFMYEAVGLLPAIISSLFLALLPNYFGYLHNNMKDVPNAFAFTLAIFLFWRLVRFRRGLDLIGAIAAFAFAFNVKINSVVVPVICLVWIALLVGKNFLARNVPISRNRVVILKQVYNLILYAVNIFGSRARMQSAKIFTLLRKALLNPILWYFLLAPLAALLLWWPFWTDPIGKLLEIPKFYSLNTYNMPVLLNGEIFRSGINIPWYYPYLYIGITTPLPILLSFVVGLLVCLKKVITIWVTRARGSHSEFHRRVSERDKSIWTRLSLFRERFETRVWETRAAGPILEYDLDSIYLLLLLWFFVPLARYSLPKMSAIDGVRHFMEVVYPLSAIAGIGGAYTLQIIRGKVNVWVIRGIGVIVFISLLFNLIKYHPYQTSYFNSLIGGINGAQGKVDIDFWGTPQREAIYWINKNAPLNSAVHIVMGQSTAASYLRGDLRRTANSKDIWESDYVVILNRQSFYTLYPVIDYMKQKEVVYTKEIDGVPLVWVFRK